MGKDELKIEQYLTDETFPGMLRELADALEFGAGKTFAGHGIQGYESLKLSSRRRYGQTLVKVKVKPEQSALGEAAEYAMAEAAGKGGADKPLKYKTLKKRMKSDYKHIAAAIRSGAVPHPSIVEAFFNDSRVMCSYSGKGDEHYSDFLIVCAALKSACDVQDLEGAAGALAALTDRMAQCHDMYK